MMEATNPTETAHIGMVKIMLDLKNVGDIKEALDHTPGMNPFEKLTSYLEGRT